MRSYIDDEPALSTEIGLKGCPSDLLCRIQELFNGMGMLGRTVSLEHEGNRYRVSCNEKRFVVYRVNISSAGMHHVPGWPVCLVDAHGVFEEHSLSVFPPDHCACSTDIAQWLRIVEDFGRTNLSFE